MARMAGIFYKVAHTCCTKSQRKKMGPSERVDRFIHNYNLYFDHRMGLLFQHNSTHTHLIRFFAILPFGNLFILIRVPLTTFLYITSVTFCSFHFFILHLYRHKLDRGLGLFACIIQFSEKWY